MSEWQEGYPEEIGLYACRVDGTEKTLIHKYCELNGKHRWMSLQGHDVLANEILWQKKISSVDDIK